MAYLSVSALKTHLGISETTDDVLLEDIIDGCKSIIDGQLGMTFEAATNTSRTFDAIRDVDGYDLLLDYPLCSINSITNGDGTTVTTAQYTTEPRNSTPYFRIRLLSSTGILWTYVTNPENAITVSGKWAYSTTVPTDVAFLTRLLAQHFYRQRDNAGELISTVITGGTTVLPANLSDQVMKLAKRYMRRL